ncbi:MAG: isoamylase early set domain-containing protein [Anaerolineae bacterium]
MSIKKQFLKTRPVCKVTFRLTKDEAGDAETVHLVGDFNDWDTTATPMKHLKSGDFKAILDLDLETEYQFRYLIDEEKWVNEEDADKLVDTPYPDVENSVIAT